MKKPKKKTKNNHNCIGLCECETYNQAHDVWEKYNRQEIKIVLDHIERLKTQIGNLPSKKEINQLYCKDCPHKICKQECDMNRWIVTNAFSKRIGNDGQGQK